MVVLVSLCPPAPYAVAQMQLMGDGGGGGGGLCRISFPG